MKKFKINLAHIAVITALSVGMVACGGDDEDIVPSPGGDNGDNQTPQPSQGNDPIFPEFTTLNGAAGDTLSLTFTATTNWQLTTNTLWCKLDNGLYDISGTTGAQNIKVIITDANLGFVVDSTDITMKVNQESKVIAKVYRKANSYTISVTEYGIINEEKIEFNQESPIVIDHYGSITLRVEANFEWIPNCDAEWIEISKEEEVLNLSVKDGYTQNPINGEDVVTFSNEHGVLLTIPVSYTGMNPESIIIEPSSKWNLQVSTDGTSYSESSLNDGEAVISQAPYVAKLTALNNAYTILAYNLDATTGMVLMEDEVSKWFTVTDDKAGNISVSFTTNNGSERSGYLLAIPNGHYDKIKDTLTDAICDKSTEYWDMKPEYEKYTIAHFVQQANITSDLADVTASYLRGSMKSIPTQMLTSLNPMGDIFGYATTTFGVSSVAYLQPDINTSLQIIPSVEEWCENEEPDENDVYPPVVEVFVNDNSTDNVATDFGTEPWQSNNKMALQIRVPEAQSGSIVYVVFKKNGENKQVAVLDMR